MEIPALKAIREQFETQGFSSPIRVLSSGECRKFLTAAAKAGNDGAPLDWHKGNAVNSRVFYEIGTNPGILEVVASLLGEDVMLWGASIQTRPPRETHPWHTDIETSSSPPGKSLSVWIGLRHTSTDSSLLVIPYSHRFGVTVQEFRSQFGRSRDELSNDEILEWARGRDMRSHLVGLEMTDGEAVFFDGQLWHGSHNLSEDTRQALLLQYATPDTVIRIPDLKHLDWPFRCLSVPEPPCLIVKGSAKAGANRIVPAPDGGRLGSDPKLPTRIYPLQIPLVPDEQSGWKPYPIFKGSSPILRSLSCHASVLTQGQCPHPPHTHDEEEILFLLAGEVDLVLPAERDSDGHNRRRLRPGQFVYYPAHFPHTLETVSKHPANYVMFKWCGGSAEIHSPLPFNQFNLFNHPDNSSLEGGFFPRLVFEGPTAYLGKLHCHTSTLLPCAGYDPHVDAYDVAIIVLEGEIETLGERGAPHSVIFYPAGEPHGMHNPGSAIAQYVVFEFHGSNKWAAQSHSPRPLSIFAKLRDPQRVKRRLKHLMRRFTLGILSNRRSAERLN
jgi:mannose-6-phosphate isomerase-like protein (cupin superfamily)